MADARPHVSLSSLTPEQVAQADFSSSFRGFDHTEVRSFLARVSGELRALLEREAVLAEQLEAAENKPPTVVGELDEHVIMERLGAEAVRVLEVARESAAQIRANAEAEAMALREAAEADAAAARAAAEAEAAELTARAEAVLVERTEEAEEAAEAIRARSEAEAAEVAAAAEEARRQALAEGEAERDHARTEGRRMVAEARAVRERILTDMARRRNVARQQLERMRAGRDRLLEAVDVVRRAVEESSEELNGALVDAKIAGERAARHIDVDVVPSPRELELEVELAKEAGLVDPAEVAAAVARPPADDDDRPDDDHTVEAELQAQERADEAEADAAADEAALLAGGDELAAAGDEGHGAVAPDAPEELVDRHVVSLDEDIEAVTVVEPPAAEPEPTEPATSEPDAPADEAAAAPDEAAPDEAALEEAAPEAAASSATPAGEEAPAKAPRKRANRRRNGTGAPARAADDVFARLRQEGDDAAPPGPAPAHSAAEPEPAAAAEPAATDDAVAEEDVESSPDAVATHRRDAQVAVAARDLSRLLKLRLADDQNELLERARSAGGLSAEGLFDLAELKTAYAELAGGELAAAAETGWRAVAPSGGSEAVDVDDLATRLVDELLDDLHQRLSEDAVAGGEGTSIERIRALYREVRNQRAGAAAEHAVLVAFSRGQLAAARRAGGREPGYVVRWSSQSCGPDCLDNSLAGRLPPGEAFPTGHLHPPAFAGCRCLLVVEPVDAPAVV